MKINLTRHLLFGLLLSFASFSASADVTALSAEEAYSKASRGEIQLVDVRTPAEWAQSGIPQYAIPVQLQRDDFIETIKQMANDKPDVPVAFICRSGGRSASAASMLDKAGYDVINVSEGVVGQSEQSGWLSKNLPVRDFSE